MISIEQFYPEYLDREDRLVLNLEMVLIFSGLIYLLLNALTFQYSGNHYLSSTWLWITPALLVFTLFSAYVKNRKISPLIFLLRAYSLYFIAFFAFLVMLNGVQYTPFPAIDSYLAKANRLFYIDEPALMNWTYTHPWLLKLFQIAYDSSYLQLMVMPLALFLLKKKEFFYHYLIVVLLAYMIGAMVYYFFPTVGPAGAFSDPNFTREQLQSVLIFRGIHQYLLVNTFEGGIINFPYFHILCSIIATYTLRTAPLWFFLPVLLWSFIAIMATLCLGWNYAIDLICGGFIAWLAIYGGKKLLFNNA